MRRCLWLPVFRGAHRRLRWVAGLALAVGVPLASAAQPRGAGPDSAGGRLAQEAGSRLQSRNIFIEAAVDGWVVTEVFHVTTAKIHRGRSPEDAIAWAHPLPPEATSVLVSLGESEDPRVSSGEGGLVVHGPLESGTHTFLARYRLDDPFIAFPVVEPGAYVEILVAAPTRAIRAPTLTDLGSLELHPGVWFRRFAREGARATSVRIEDGARLGAPEPSWLAILTALALLYTAIHALGRSDPRRAIALKRRHLVQAIAELDESPDAQAPQSRPEGEAYEARRRELIRRLEHLIRQTA